MFNATTVAEAKDYVKGLNKKEARKGLKQIESALKRFNKGKGWIQGSYTYDSLNIKPQYCAVGALTPIGKLFGENAFPESAGILNILTDHVGIVDWNDDSNRTYSDVSKVFHHAKRLFEKRIES